MPDLVEWMNEHFYRDIPASADHFIFRDEILRVIRPEHEILDVGAGAGILEAMNFRGKVKRVCGIDPDPRIAENPYLDDAKVGLADEIPYPDESFDVVVSANVLEHLENPVQVFREVRRVLKPGGIFLAKTPNLWHYMPPIAMMVPSRFHDRLSRKPGGNPEDTFPTLYRANSRASISRWAEESGLAVRSVDFYDVRPGYLAFNGVTYFIGTLYHWLVTRVPGLQRFGGFLIAELVRV